MDLLSIGRLIAERRRVKGLTLVELAAQAQVGRSTLAALEAGKLAELGLTRGDLDAWRGLVRAMRADQSGRVAQRVRDVSAAVGKHYPRARAFAVLLPKLMAGSRRGATAR